ncbi:MAG: haloalkane dehalogenase [Vicinamibacterales bacterium]
MALVNRRQWLQTAVSASLVGAGPASAGLQAQSRSWAERKKKAQVRGLQMAYYEVGNGDPIVFLHGNPTSSYLWRNVIPHVQHLGRCIAPDLIGMGDSDRLPDSGPERYTFREHQEYLFALFDTLNLGNRVTLVIHDWGSALGATWAKQHRTRVKGIAYMEAIIEPPGAPRPAPAPGSTFDIYRSARGEQAVLQENRFVESLISGLDYYLTDADAAEYRRPYLTPGESRRPTLTWPRELPLGGEPRHTYELVRDYSDWLAADTAIPKLFVRAAPGALLARPEALAFVRGFKNQREVTVYGPHFVQEVSPDAIGRALAAWLPTLR